GTSVAISGDTVVVGAPNDDTGAGTDAGSAYVFAPPGDPYADAVTAATLVLNPSNAVGAPDGNVASVVSLFSLGSLKLDLGAGEEGAGDLKVYYQGLSAEVVTTVDFYDAEGELLSSGALHLTQLGGGAHTAVVDYSGSTPYRYVRLRGVLLLSFGVDAVEALAP